MKKDLDMTFEEFPLNVPSEKRIIIKLDSLIQELEECGSALTASLAIKHWNKYMTQLSTDTSVIMVRYTCDTKSPVYKRAQDRVDELSPIIANYSNKFAKILTKAKYRKDLEKKFGKYYFQMMDASLKTFDEKIIPELQEINKLDSDALEIIFIGNGFLKYMVRIMVGTLIDIGLGKKNVDDIDNIFMAKDRSKASKTASPNGLFLYNVWYKED